MSRDPKINQEKRGEANWETFLPRLVGVTFLDVNAG